MTKKNYNKPAMRVVQMKQRQRLLESSGVSATRKSYEEPVEYNWE